MSNNIASTSTSAPTAGLSTVEINEWSRNRVKEFLQERRAELDLEDEDINIIYNQRVRGDIFLKLTEVTLERWGIPGGPAIAITELVKQVKGAGILKSNTGLVSVFVDNSNLFIEGKNSFYLNQLHIDHGHLLSTILKRQQMGSNPIIVGSRPLPNDSLWKQIRNQGYDVVVYNRNIENKEKKVDMALGVSIMNVIWFNNPGVLILIAGDGDYEPVINEALKHKWKVEIWFWSSAAQHLHDLDIQEQVIMAHIGHKSVQGIRIYKKVNKEQQLNTVNALINITDR
ncbi:2397_t:CDS:2, partial [Acaulospora morrowiae]